MKFCSENAKDIGKYYIGTYMKFPTFAGDILHCVDEVTGSCVRGRFWDGKSEEPFEFHLWSQDDTDHNCPDVEFVLPIKSMFMHNGSAMFLYRNPQRQYRKGVCGDNTNVVILTSEGQWSARGVGFDLLSSYVGKQAFGGFAALDGAPKLSVALSARIAVSADGQLFADMNKIGMVDWAAKTVNVKEKLFLPEVEELLGGGYTIAKVVQPTKKARKISGKYGINEDGEVVKMEEINGID